MSVPSEVPDQPFTDPETLLGTQNRAVNVRRVRPDTDNCVGIEGGVGECAGSLCNFAWVVIVDCNRRAYGHVRPTRRNGRAGPRGYGAGVCGR